ncbi:MAG: hypothetical protein ACREE2_19045 [Stellaceae bacterium]
MPQWAHSRLDTLAAKNKALNPDEIVTAEVPHGRSAAADRSLAQRIAVADKEVRIMGSKSDLF